MSISVVVFDLVGGWSTFDPARFVTMVAEFNASGLQGSRPDRWGFVQTSSLDQEAIYGLFVQEYQRVLVEYSEAKQEIVTPDEDTARYFFAVLPAQRSVILQKRRSPLPGFPNWPTVIGRFEELFKLVAYRAGVPIPDRLVPVERENTREDILAAFRDPRNRVTLIDVEELREDLLPAEFHFFNPNFDNNAAYDVGMRRTARHARRVAMEATAEGDLAQSPEARGFVQMAQRPRMLRVVDRETSVTTRLETRRERTREVELSTDELSNETVALAIRQALTGSRAPRLRHQGRAPEHRPSLFDLLDAVEGRSVDDEGSQTHGGTPNRPD